MHSTQFIQFAQCFRNESIGLTVRSLRTLPYPAKLPQYCLSYIGLAKERSGDEPSRLRRAEITRLLVSNITAPLSNQVDPCFLKTDVVLAGI